MQKLITKNLAGIIAGLLYGVMGIFLVIGLADDGGLIGKKVIYGCYKEEAESLHPLARRDLDSPECLTSRSTEKLVKSIKWFNTPAIYSFAYIFSRLASSLPQLNDSLFLMALGILWLFSIVVNTVLWGVIGLAVEVSLKKLFWKKQRGESLLA